jgi:hypothetical protein
VNYLARLRGMTIPHGGGRETPAPPTKNPETPIRGTDKTDKSPFCQFGGLLSVPDFGKNLQPAPPPNPAPAPAPDRRPPAETWEERAAILEFDGGLTRAEAEEQATCRRWLIHLPDGWLDTTHTPPASRAEVQAWYPEALAIHPADDGEDDPEDGEPGPQEEGDPGARFYAEVFRGMAGPRCSVTLNPAEIHRAVVAGLLDPAAARGAVILAARDPQGHCALFAIPQERWDPFKVLALLAEPGTVH